MIKFARISPPHLELNIVLNIQSPGDYADSLNVKGKHYKLNVETPYFTLFIYIHIYFFFFFFFLKVIYMVTTAGATPPHLGWKPYKHMLLFLFTESLAWLYPEFICPWGSMMWKKKSPSDFHSRCLDKHLKHVKVPHRWDIHRPGSKEWYMEMPGSNIVSSLPNEWRTGEATG